MKAPHPSGKYAVPKPLRDVWLVINISKNNQKLIPYCYLFCCPWGLGSWNPTKRASFSFLLLTSNTKWAKLSVDHIFSIQHFCGGGQLAKCCFLSKSRHFIPNKKKSFHLNPVEPHVVLVKHCFLGRPRHFILRQEIRNVLSKYPSPTGKGVGEKLFSWHFYTVHTKLRKICFVQSPPSY